MYISKKFMQIVTLLLLASIENFVIFTDQGLQYENAVTLC